MFRTSTFFPNQVVRPSWLETWSIALTQPRVATYQALASQPAFDSQIACGWLFSSSLLGGLLLSWHSRWAELDHLVAPNFLLAVLLYAVIALGSWLFFALCTQWVAGRLHGQGNYTLLLTTFATFSAPLTLITTLFSWLPYHQLPTLCLYGYWLLLYLLAIKAVNRFSWWRAASTLFLTLSAGAILWVGILLAMIILPI